MPKTDDKVVVHETKGYALDKDANLHSSIHGGIPGAKSNEINEKDDTTVMTFMLNSTHPTVASADRPTVASTQVQLPPPLIPRSHPLTQWSPPLTLRSPPLTPRSPPLTPRWPPLTSRSETGLGGTQVRPRKPSRNG